MLGRTGTYCQGFKMEFTRAIDCSQYMSMIIALETSLNDKLDPEHRRYRILPEKITEGAFHLVSFPGKTPGGAQYKTMRHFIHDKPFHEMRPYPWPWFTISVEALMSEWMESGEGVPFIPQGATSRTYLKALRDAPAWTLDELHCMAGVLETEFGVLCTHFPTTSHLTMNYGPF